MNLLSAVQCTVIRLSWFSLFFLQIEYIKIFIDLEYWLYSIQVSRSLFRSMHFPWIFHKFNGKVDVGVEGNGILIELLDFRRSFRCRLAAERYLQRFVNFSLFIGTESGDPTKFQVAILPKFKMAMDLLNFTPFPHFQIVGNLRNFWNLPESLSFSIFSQKGSKEHFKNAWIPNAHWNFYV